jgi:hypothetical protein
VRRYGRELGALRRLALAGTLWLHVRRLGVRGAATAWVAAERCLMCRGCTGWLHAGCQGGALRRSVAVVHAGYTCVHNKPNSVGTHSMLLGKGTACPGGFNPSTCGRTHVFPLLLNTSPHNASQLAPIAHHRHNATAARAGKRGSATRSPARRRIRISAHGKLQQGKSRPRTRTCAHLGVSWPHHPIPMALGRKIEQPASQPVLGRL